MKTAWRGLGYGKIHDSLLLIAPLFLAYQIGLLFQNGQNGVDFVSGPLFQLVDHDRQRYLLLQLGFALLLFVYSGWSGRWRVLRGQHFVPIVLESAIYALTLGSFILFVMKHLLGIEVLAMSALPHALAEMGHILVVSLGAGVHEELVFRLGAMGLGGLALSRVGFAKGPAVFLAAALSGLVFSWAHVLGPAGESYDGAVFVYRLLAGLFFAALFYYRSLAHAVYTHAFYDLYVLGVAA